MYPLLAEKIIYPLSDVMLGTSVMKYYRELMETQWWPRASLEELQNRKLRALIEHAYSKVPYYRRMFDELGIKSSDIQTVDDLRKLPVLTKKKIRQNSKDMKSDDFEKKKPISSSTGGSTGEPLQFFITSDVASINWAGLFRGFSWGGYRIGDKRIKFGGSSIIPNKAPSLFEWTRNKLERNLALSVASVDEEKYIRYIENIMTYKPKYLYGYASSLYLLAEFIKTRNSNSMIHPAAIFSTSEMLLPKYRETIEEQFKCKVFDIYGSYDGGVQAMECEVHRGFHITIEKTVVEIVNDEGKNLSAGESGRIIVTDLHNYAMPFIRYEVGDIGALSDEKCSCGRGLPLLKYIEGRTNDIINLSNGITLSGLAISIIFKDLPVQQYQIVQQAPDRILIKIVKNAHYTQNHTDYILNAIQKAAGKNISLCIEFCSIIQPSPSGKLKTVIRQYE